MGNERTQTIRQEIITCLEQGPMTMRELSRTVGIMEKDVCHHLEFIGKTVRSLNRKIRIKPYYCLDCGFIFKDRKKFKKPGKCPGCKKGRIGLAEFSIES